jgi:hypothetical protein
VVFFREVITYHLCKVNMLTRNRLLFDHPAIYEIRVQGRIDPNWSDRLDGMAISLAISDANPPVTTLVGELNDQAALLGVLNSLYELHLPVLSVLCQSSPPGSDKGIEQH